MKKIYSAPVIEIDVLEPMSILAGSPEIKAHAEWGAKGTYAPEDWVNEQWGRTEIGSIPTEVAGNEPGDWASRSNGGTWE